MRIPYISNVTQSSGLLSLAAASVMVGAPAELGNKNSLAFASDIGSLVVTGRFRDLGITLQRWKPCALEPVLCNERSLCTTTREKPGHKEDLARPKINKYVK